jgi:predicted PurR-regulated permease PerM
MPDPEPTPPSPAPPPAAAPTALPLDLRSGSLFVLAAVATIYMLHWAKGLFIPLMVGLTLSIALSPVVDFLERWRIPRVIGAGLLLFGALGASAYAAYALADDAAALLETLPEAAQKVRDQMQASPGDPQGTIQKVRKAAEGIERVAAARSAASAPAAEGGVTRVQIEKPDFSISDYLWTGTLGLAGAVGQTIAVTFIAYFLLVSGKTFRRKFVRIAGPTFTRRRITVQALDEMTAQIQRYLLVQIFTSIVVGVASWLAFLWLGLNHAAVWGIVAGVLDLIPYIGLVVICGATALVGFMQFNSFEMALLISGASAVIHAIESYLLTPWLTSQASRLNPVAVFIGVIAWGWLWGIWGLLLGVPILMIVKAVCDRVDDLKPIGELLGT